MTKGTEKTRISLRTGHRLHLTTPNPIPMCEPTKDKVGFSFFFTENEKEKKTKTKQEKKNPQEVSICSVIFLRRWSEVSSIVSFLYLNNCNALLLVRRCSLVCRGEGWQPSCAYFIGGKANKQNKKKKITKKNQTNKTPIHPYPFLLSIFAPFFFFFAVMLYLACFVIYFEHSHQVSRFIFYFDFYF